MDRVKKVIKKKDWKNEELMDLFKDHITIREKGIY
jgi:hypothetical protein